MAPPQHSRPSAAFTLVEVALALGIISFAFVGLLALLPAGNTAFRRAVDISVCSQIAQRIIGEAQESSFAMVIDEANASSPDPLNFTFIAPYRRTTTPRARYFDDQGREIIPANGATTPDATQRRSVVYEVNTRINTRVPLPATVALTTLDSGLATTSPLAQITVQVAHNPAGIKLPYSTAPAFAAANPDPQRNLWVLTPQQAGIDILTYSALIARAK